MNKLERAQLKVQFREEAFAHFTKKFPWWSTTRRRFLANKKADVQISQVK